MKKSGHSPSGKIRLRSVKGSTPKKEKSESRNEHFKIARGELRSIINSLPSALLMIDSRRCIQFANESFCAMFRVEGAEIEGKSIAELADTSWNIPILPAILERVLAQGSSLRNLKIEQNFPRVGHKELVLHATATHLNGSGSVAAVLAIEDRTAETRPATDRGVERTSLVKDEFLAVLSHELRTPLTTILGWAQTLRLGKSDVEKTERAIAVIEKSAKDQGQLIDDLLDVSRLQSGKMQLNIGEIDPNDCIAAALESVRNTADGKSIAIETKFDPTPCVINADSTRMEQVFRNLFTNAVKFTARGGKVSLRSKLRKDKKQIEIQVEDTGKGIRPEFLPYLFTGFSQEDSSTKRMFGGLGLGLSIVRNLVQMHQGTVTAFSPGEGKGSIFTVTLPCMIRSSQNNRTHGSHEGDAAQGRPASLKGLKVLVIDDLEDARDAFSAILQSSSAQVETAPSAAKGLAALIRFKPDLTLCDMAMPSEDGMSFIRKLRGLNPGKGGKTPAIAVTAYANTADVSKALDAGFDAHLSKPVDAVELSHLIAKLVRRAKNRR
jgi:two-component system, chemotaxis family, CheB/CheR fusion protein